MENGTSQYENIVLYQLEISGLDYVFQLEEFVGPKGKNIQLERVSI